MTHRIAVRATDVVGAGGQLGLPPTPLRMYHLAATAAILGVEAAQCELPASAQPAWPLWPPSHDLTRLASMSVPQCISIRLAVRISLTDVATGCTHVGGRTL